MLDGRPLLVAYGMGADSTALLIEMARRRIMPDAVIFADVGGEKDETYDYRKVMNRFLDRHGMPMVTVVRYKPHKFKNFPPYDTLETNCLSNGTLPSLAFGFKSCSIKWKAAPQEKWCNEWPAARATWARGERVIKFIGYDAGPKDARRRNHAGNADDPKYEYRYPLIEWGWDRERCLAEIVREGLPGWDPEYLAEVDRLVAARDYKAISKVRPRWIERGGVPMKSSCFFCPAMKQWEVALLEPEKLRRIIAMEARAKPRHHTCQGLWRKATKTKPGSISEFILREGLLPESEVLAIQEAVPKELVQAVEDWRGEHKVTDWDEFFGDLPGFCSSSIDEDERL